MHVRREGGLGPEIDRRLLLEHHLDGMHRGVGGERIGLHHVLDQRHVDRGLHRRLGDADALEPDLDLAGHLVGGGGAALGQRHGEREHRLAGVDAGGDELDVGPGRGVELQPLERDDVGRLAGRHREGHQAAAEARLEKALFHPELRMKVGDIGSGGCGGPARRGDRWARHPSHPAPTASGLKM
ncbi:MAG: hypothetical protein WDN08_09215 [Rhizomicrobium sp.]